MDELSDYSSEVIEFKPISSLNKQQKLIDSCIATDPLPPNKNVAVGTNPKHDTETQTQIFDAAKAIDVDEKKLALWLRKIYPIMETELFKGPTPVSDNYLISGTHSEDSNIETYQKITFNMNAGTLDNLQGLATWLSVHTNNAPVLALTTIVPHDDWCEHINQSVRIYTPKRVQTSNFIVFTETKVIPVKSCLKTLTTNFFNKNIFAGSTLDGDIYIWEYEQSSGDVTELFNLTAAHGYATSMDWSAENRLLTCHSNGYIIQWLIGKQIIKENEFLLQPPTKISDTSSKETMSSKEITTLVCLSVNDFVVGTKDGGVYHCWNSNMSALKKQLEITRLRSHLFMVSSLLKAKMSGHNVVISCDLSGQVFYHDLRNPDDDNSNVIIQIPLPFKNSIACSRDGRRIYCPGIDGSLECFSLTNGVHSIIKGALRGKGSLIKCSPNGNWIVTGLYMDEFQIFFLEN